MREVLPGVHQWSWFSPDKGIDFNGLHVDFGGGAILIDPPPFSEPDEHVLDRLAAPSSVIITNRHHGRASAWARERFGAAVLVPQLDSESLGFGFDGTYAEGELLPCGFIAVVVRGSKSPGESALHHRGTRLLVLGDALIGKPPGDLSLLPPPIIPDRDAALAGIRLLLELDFESVLVGDGVSVPSGGKEAMRRACAPPAGVKA